MAVLTRVRPAVESPLFASILLVAGLAATAKLAALGLQSASGATLTLSPVALAVLLGILWRHTAGVPATLEPGIALVMQPLLRTGIALVGLRLTLGEVGVALPLAIAVAFAGITAALAISLCLARLFGLPRPLALLLAVGTSVCGCTAIAVAAPLVRARPAETGVALTCVVLLGTFGMLVYPWLGHLLLGDRTAAVGVFLGTAIHDTSQVMGAALIYAQQYGAPDVVATAGFTKLLRNLSMLVLIPVLALLARQGPAAGDGTRPAAAGAVPARAKILPPFLVAFMVLAVARTVLDGTLPADARPAWDGFLALALGISDLCLACGLAAVGLSVSLSQVRKIGPAGLGVACAVAATVAAGSLFLTSHSGL